MIIDDITLSPVRERSDIHASPSPDMNRDISLVQTKDYRLPGSPRSDANLNESPDMLTQNEVDQVQDTSSQTGTRRMSKKAAPVSQFNN